MKGLITSTFMLLCTPAIAQQLPPVTTTVNLISNCFDGADLVRFILEGYQEEILFVGNAEISVMLPNTITPSRVYGRLGMLVNQDTGSWSMVFTVPDEHITTCVITSGDSFTPM